MSEYIDYPRWPQLAREALRQQLDVKRDKYNVNGRVLDYSRDFVGYVVTGMGGSGIVGDILLDYLSIMLRKPIIVVKDLELPPYIDERYLVLSISYSGNTAETVSCYLECIDKSIPVVAISTGGKLRDLAEKYGLPYVPVPRATAPRYALPGLLYSTLNVLSLFEPSYRDRIIRDSISSIDDIERAVREYTCIRDLALRLSNKHVVVFVPRPVLSIGLRFKNDMNENAKQLVTVCMLPESEHNDIAAFVRKHRDLEIVIVRSGITENLNLGYRKHADAVKKVLEEYGYNPIEYKVSGSSLLGEIMYGITQLGMLTIDVARSLEIDPVSIEAIDRVKKYIS